MKVFKVVGKVFKKSIGIGAWGIVDNQGVEYRPIFMPEQLKSEGASVVVTVKNIQEEFSIHIWGKPIEIMAFHTLNP